MQIQADKEWMQVIHKLLDLSLRANWIQALDEINEVLKSTSEINLNTNK